MTQKNIEQEISEIHKKLDFLTAQLVENQRRQKEMDELKDDVALIGRDIFNAVSTELDDVAHHFETKDLLHLVKRLLRNTKNINRLLQQMESMEDLYRDIQPLGKQIFDEVLGTLNELDRKGYFEFMRESAKIVDTVVTSFDIEDVKLLRENITSIILTIKSMTQPEMLSTIDNAIGFFRKMDITVEQEISYFKLFKEMRNPEVKQGMLFMLEFVKNMAKPVNNEPENSNQLKEN